MRKIPKFRSDEEARKFWQSHSFKDYKAETSEAQIKFVKKPKKTVAIRIAPEDTKAVERIAERMGLSYTSLLRMWIKEHLAKEGHVA
jgi:predicted DNA binding CopG/RHH family protein